MSKIRKSARNRECQVRIIGICNGNPETVVWAHANGLASGRGICLKSNDLSGAYACSACHAAYDRAVYKDTREYLQIENDFFHGHLRSLQILIDEGIVKI